MKRKRVTKRHSSKGRKSRKAVSKFGRGGLHSFDNSFEFGHEESSDSDDDLPLRGFVRGPLLGAGAAGGGPQPGGAGAGPAGGGGGPAGGGGGPPPVSHWRKIYDEVENDVFFWDEISGDSQWEQPADYDLTRDPGRNLVPRVKDADGKTLIDEYGNAPAAPPPEEDEEAPPQMDWSLPAIPPIINFAQQANDEATMTMEEQNQFYEKFVFPFFTDKIDKLMKRAGLISGDSKQIVFANYLAQYPDANERAQLLKDDANLRDQALLTFWARPELKLQPQGAIQILIACGWESADEVKRLIEIAKQHLNGQTPKVFFHHKSGKMPADVKDVTLISVDEISNGAVKFDAIVFGKVCEVINATGIAAYILRGVDGLMKRFFGGKDAGDDWTDVKETQFPMESYIRTEAGMKILLNWLKFKGKIILPFDPNWNFLWESEDDIDLQIFLMKTLNQYIIDERNKVIILQRDQDARQKRNVLVAGGLPKEDGKEFTRDPGIVRAEKKMMMEYIGFNPDQHKLFAAENVDMNMMLLFNNPVTIGNCWESQLKFSLILINEPIVHPAAMGVTFDTLSLPVEGNNECLKKLYNRLDDDGKIIFFGMFNSNRVGADRFRKLDPPKLKTRDTRLPFFEKFKFSSKSFTPVGAVQPTWVLEITKRFPGASWEEDKGVVIADARDIEQLDPAEQTTIKRFIEFEFDDDVDDADDDGEFNGEYTDFNRDDKDAEYEPDDEETAACKELMNQHNIKTLADLRKWTLAHHPDKLGRPQNPEEADLFGRINNCKRVLENPEPARRNGAKNILLI